MMFSAGGRLSGRWDEKPIVRVIAMDAVPSITPGGMAISHSEE
jgi:hypothetical protein